MLTSPHCFFLIVSLFYFTNQYQASAVHEGVEPGLDPRKWKSSTIQIGSAGANRDSPTQEAATTSHHDVIALKPNRTKLDRDTSVQRPTPIPNCEFENANQEKTYPTQLSFKSESSLNSRSDPKQIRRRHSLLTIGERIFGQGRFTSSFGIPSPTNDDTDKGVRVDGRAKGISVASLNLTVTVPTLDVCIHVCLAHALCTSAAFHVRKSICGLRGKMDDVEHQQLRPGRVKIHVSENSDVRIFTVNPTALTHVLGKCADRPCSNGTFCSRSIPTGYRCLPLGKFLRRIQNENVQHEDDNKVQRAGLVRKKRSLRQRREGSKPKGKVVDCGLPPKLPRALSLYRSTLLGASATYFCEEGVHTQQTWAVLYCQPNGNWTKPLFRCVPDKKCKLPNRIPNTVMHFYALRGIKMVSYACKNDKSHAHVSSCDPLDGTWSNVNIICNGKPHGKDTSSWKILRTKNRKFSKTKKRSRNITHAKKKSFRTLGDNTVNQNRKPQTLSNQTYYQKKLDVPESVSKNSKHFGESITSTESANKPKTNVPKQRLSMFETESRPKKVNGSNRSNFTKDNPNSDKEFSTQNPTKPYKKNSEQPSSLLSLKNVTEPSKTGLEQKKVHVSPKFAKNVTVGRKPFKRPKTPPRNNTNTPENSRVESSTFTSKAPKVTATLKNPKFIHKNSTGFNSSTSVSLISVPSANTTHKPGSFNSSGEHRAVEGNNKTDSKPAPHDAAKTNSTGNPNSVSGNSDLNQKNSSKIHALNNTNQTKPNNTSDVLEKTGTHNESSVSNKTTSEKKGGSNPEREPEEKKKEKNGSGNRSNEVYDWFLKARFIIDPDKAGLRGVIRADINAHMGVPGFMCSRPGKLHFASTFYSSRIIGSKASFQCKKYFFASPVPYCPIVTCLKQGIWSELFLSCSDLDCVNPATMYEGKRICSSSGFECKRWDEVVTDPKTIGTLHFSENNISMAHNYCRDPLRQGTPWCFTKNPTVIWDYCDIPFCP